MPFSKDTLINNAPNKYSRGNEEDKTKAWFKDNKSIIDKLMPQFIRAYSSTFDTFVRKLVKKYNVIIGENYPQNVPIKFRSLK